MRMVTQSPSAECYYRFSNSYCPDETFFSRVGGEFLNSAGCFYFNSTDTVVEEAAITDSQTTETIA